MDNFVLERILPFIGGMINYILENELYHKEYVATYTNAANIVGDDFSFDDGMFSGYNEEKRSYDKTKWAFKTDAEGKTLKRPNITGSKMCIPTYEETL